MKTMKNLALMGAIALTGAVGFTACSSSNDVAENNLDNPNYNPETNAVKTEFVINVTQPGERTRMAPADAGAGAFQGLKNMQLFCMTGVPATVDNAITSAKTLPLTSYNTPTLDGDNTTGSSKVYTLYIPNGTTNFLFYATTYETVGDNYKFTYGSLVNNLDAASTVATATPATTDIKFNLEPIAPTEATVTTPQNKLLEVLNGIAGAAYDKNNTPLNAADDIKWATIATETSTYSDTHWQALRTAFNQFTNQASGGDVRQGSSAAILSMVSDLFDAVNPIYVNESNDDAKNVAKAVLDKIVIYFNVTVSSNTYTWPSRDYNAGYSVNYPEGQHLPTGSAVLRYNAGVFSYVNDGTMGTAAVSTAYNKFTYPSELTYYCNSLLRQTTANKNVTGDYPTTSADWADDNNAKWTGWTTGAVTAATRAVAMKDNITYGAAQLISNVKLGADVGTSEENALVDNATTVTGGVVTDQKFYTGDNAITLRVHGLLIGGQPDAARYDYLPQGDNTASNVVYDLFSSTGTAVTTTAWTTPNYTLVLDNFKSGEGDQNTVNVALEMTADKDFYGASGKIKAGQKFYLIGSLDPAHPATGSSITWANHTSFKDGDTGYNVNRVFIRDAKTEATFTLGANCLKSAYSTIPDLRSTQMVFGISVDLAWKTGLVFDVPIN